MDGDSYTKTVKESRFCKLMNCNLQWQFIIQLHNKIGYVLIGFVCVFSNFPQVIPLLKSRDSKAIWQQDGASIHTTDPTMDYLKGTISVLEWPAKSPDLSIIE